MTYTDDSHLPVISDEDFDASREGMRPYTIVLLKKGPKYSPIGPNRDPEVAAVIYRHGRRNMQLRLAGLLRVVCPVADDSELAGVAVFDATPKECDAIYSRDPAVMASLLTYEIHATRTFPDSSLS
ncbi:MAG TPA: hypothetical protein VGV88_02950 [Candidatus Dormibacteraeota bacterium]|nr:hypothetical protein [Candidatus Dormibacteraeota bacterium]